METGAVASSLPDTSRSVLWRLITAATLLLLATIALIWLVAVPIGTGVCPTVDPPPTNCQSSYRAGSGLVATLVAVGIWVATIAVALVWRRAARSFVVAGVVILALAPVVTYLAVAWSPGFTLAAAAPAPPTDDPVGQWGEISERSAYLTILEDGTVAGSDGCNGFGGTWYLTGGVVEFSDMITTLMMCPPRHTDLRGPAVTGIAKGDLLYVLDADGHVSGILPRAVDD
ncbi:META domain-containing protein [Microbacter sp. GSS18]|nr:META domain-containing protein [Microbacter sp. GSS18]